jgi:hypothetical protein
MPVETPRFSRALEAHLREQAARGRRHLPSPRPVLAVAAILFALGFVLVVGGRDEDAPDPVAGAYTITAADLTAADPAELRRLEREFAARGERLIVTEKGVAPGSRQVGQVLSLSIPGPAQWTRDHRTPIVVEELDGPVRVTIAVADQTELHEGLAICETVPQMKRLVNARDPDGSIRRLRAAGFEIEVRTVPWDRPGDRDVLIGIYGPDGDVTGIPPEEKRFTVEVGSPGEGHDGVSC